YGQRMHDIARARLRSAPKGRFNIEELFRGSTSHSGTHHARQLKIAWALLHKSGSSSYDVIMRRFSARFSWWVVLPLAALAAMLNGFGLFRRVHATPPPVQASLPATSSTDDGPHKINHVLIISEDGLRADAVAKLHLHWHELLRKRG